jgi:TPR repeat protein
MYEEGQGVAQDYAEAVKWFRKSAEQGNEEAKKFLERLQSLQR